MLQAHHIVQTLLEADPPKDRAIIFAPELVRTGLLLHHSSDVPEKFRYYGLNRHTATVVTGYPGNVRIVGRQLSMDGAQIESIQRWLGVDMLNEPNVQYRSGLETNVVDKSSADFVGDDNQEELEKAEPPPPETGGSKKPKPQTGIQPFFNDDGYLEADHVYGPAKEAGVKPGDIVLKINGRQMTSKKVYLSTVAEFSVGQPVSLVIQRDGKRYFAKIVAFDDDELLPSLRKANDPSWEEMEAELEQQPPAPAQQPPALAQPKSSDPLEALPKPPSQEPTWKPEFD